VASPDGLALGPGKTAFITGLPIYNEVGATAGYTTPGISYSQPSDLANFHNSIAAATESIYQAFGQGHLLAVESDLAGISREILRHDADLKRQTYERTVVAALEQLLTTLLKLQGYDYPVTVELQNASGYVSPEIKTQIMAEYDRGLLSKATTMAKLGTIEDPDAELALIDQESSTTQLVAKSAMDSAFGAFVDGEPEPDEVGKGEKVSAK
jgi:hypothetical protein